MIKQSFDPILATSPKILVLGSLPGDRSLEYNQYYAHPQNRFWAIITALLNAKSSIDYNSRINLLIKTGICLWDVCKSAYRQGSMDADIFEETPNDIINFLSENPSISTIFFNGQKAQKLYDKYFDRFPDIQYFTLPSTSPANARYTKTLLENKWRVLIEEISRRN